LSLQQVARRYASALADVAVERGEEREVQTEIDAWVSMVDAAPLLREVFANPTIPYDQKGKVLEDLISRSKVRDTTASFLRVLLKNQRLSELKEVAARYGQVLDERAGVVAAHVTTARAIPEDLKNSLHQALAESTGKVVRLSFTTDESLIGGVVARVGSTIFDGSVRSQLERLALTLTDGRVTS
jgi:F-type H+-transporting ATPase subunit delta